MSVNLRVNCPLCGRFMTIIAKDISITNPDWMYTEIGCKTCKIKQDLDIPIKHLTKYDKHIFGGKPLNKWLHSQMKDTIKRYGIYGKEEK